MSAAEAAKELEALLAQPEPSALAEKLEHISALNIAAIRLLSVTVRELIES
jgi:hypothetical protein